MLNEGLPSEHKIFAQIGDLDLDNTTISYLSEIAAKHSVNINDSVKDYNHFIKNRTLRVPEDWQG